MGRADASQLAHRSTLDMHHSDKHESLSAAAGHDCLGTLCEHPREHPPASTSINSWRCAACSWKAWYASSSSPRRRSASASLAAACAARSAAAAGSGRRVAAGGAAAAAPGSAPAACAPSALPCASACLDSRLGRWLGRSGCSCAERLSPAVRCWLCWAAAACSDTSVMPMCSRCRHEGCSRARGPTAQASVPAAVDGLAAIIGLKRPVRFAGGDWAARKLLCFEDGQFGGRVLLG